MRIFRHLQGAPATIVGVSDWVYGSTAWKCDSTITWQSSGKLTSRWCDAARDRSLLWLLVVADEEE